jgi:molybdopterin-guanine dinucleotide biosynthesis protein
MSKDVPIIISVTGAHSGVGKTALCSILLKELKGFGAIKFTKTSVFASIVDDVDVLNQKGKDTAIFLESGAQRVLWVQSPYHELKSLLNIAINKMRDLKGIVIEGNSPVDFLNPHLIIFVIELNGEVKPSAIKVSKKADIIIINSEKRLGDHPFLSTIKHKGIRVFWIDLLRRRGELDEFLCFVKEKVSKDYHQREGS